MSDRTIANCPICYAPIDPKNFNWKCVVCSEENINGSVFEVCNRCKFAPRLFICPACNKEFDVMLLIGRYTGNRKEIIFPENLSYLKGYSYKLRDLDFKISNNIQEDIVRFEISYGEEIFESILDTAFNSPIILSRFLLLNYFKDNLNFNWFHGWAYQNKDWPSSPEEATAQISFYFKTIYTPSIKIKMTDVLIDSDLFISEFKL